MMSGIGTDRERQRVAIHNRTPFPCLVMPTASPPPLAAAKVASMILFPFVDRSFVAQRGGQLGQHFVQNVLLTPLLETAIDRPLATYNRKSTLNVRSHRIECLVHTAHIKMIASIRIGVLVEQLLSSVQRL